MSILSTDKRDESPFHACTLIFAAFVHTFNGTETGEEVSEGGSVDFAGDLTDVEVRGREILVGGISQRKRIAGGDAPWEIPGRRHEGGHWRAGVLEWQNEDAVP